MSQEQNAVQSEPSAKRIGSNDEENNPAERVIAAVNGKQPLADIFKLTIDCFEEVFDFLSLADLVAVGQTCKRMQLIAGHFFQMNYGAERAYFDRDVLELNKVNIDCFKNFLQRVKVNDFDLDRALLDRKLDYLGASKHSKSIKEIEIDLLFYADDNSTMVRFEKIKDVINKAEKVTIRCHEKMLDGFLGHCTNVKHLSFRTTFDPANEHQWTHRIYPMLEHLELENFKSPNVPALKTFIDLNTTIKQLSLRSTLFWANRILFRSLNHRIDTLAIEYRIDDRVEFDLFFRFLNEVHESGFHKKLHFYSDSFDGQEVIDQLASVKGLVKLQVSGYDGINVGALINLEEVHIHDSRSITDLKSIPHILLKLKRIHFLIASSNDILPFICHAKNLNKIKVKWLLSGPHYYVLDLFALNKEREKLAGARKLTIYVNEDVYLATKWAMKQTDFSLIEMKRGTSYRTY